MRQFLSFLLLIIIFTGKAQAQEIQVEDSGSHKEFVTLLKDAKNSTYQQILARYDSYITSHPKHISVKIERCKFIGSAFYDAYEDYDTNWEETERCLASLVEEYPEHPGVLMYQMDNSYGDELSNLLSEALTKYYNVPNDWFL